MTQKKSRFWTFCFSFIPGVAEMYMGFMKMGLSLMAIFWGLIAIATVLELGPVMFVALIAWFYSFFHAQNIAHSPDDVFYALEDDYLIHVTDGESKGRDFVKTYRKIIAAVLIFIGIVLVWQSMMSLMWGFLPDMVYSILRSFGYRLPRLVVGIAIIILGVVMIRGKKQELDDAAREDESSNDQSVIDVTDASGKEC